MRGWWLLMAVILLGALTYLTRDLAVAILGVCFLILAEIRFQNELLRRLVERLDGLSESIAVPSEPPSVEESPEGEEPSEGETVEGPGYHLTEPEYVGPPLEQGSD